MEQLYSYVFHYNHFTELWYAIPRDKYTKYWDDKSLEDILNAKEIDTLIHFLVRK
jgi:hypothetical protein